MGHGRLALEQRQLTDAEGRAALAFLEQLGHDPGKVAEVKITAGALGFFAEIVHVREPGGLIVPTTAPAVPAQLVIGRA